jgi:hypothetical protein
MAFSAHLPQYQVAVYKTIKRTTTDGSTPTSARFQGTSKVIDLAPWLGDKSSVTTTKSIRQPAGGFSITVPDIPYDNGLGLDSLYGVIEPMDLVEIRFRHVATAGQSTVVPIVMRGFVSQISRNETVGPDGAPVRNVVINGQDYGKLWQMIQIFYGPNYIIGEDILSSYKLLEKFGAGYSNALTNKEFVQIAFDKLINPFLATLLPSGCGFPSVTVNTDNVVEGVTGIAGIQSQEGSVYNLLRTYMDIGAFNELFITEDSDGVYCIYRQNPALGLDGNPLEPTVTLSPYAGTLAVDATRLVLIDIPDSDIISLNVQRSDQGVANYYWVQPDGWNLNTDSLTRQMGYSADDRASVDLSDYANSAKTLYGMRLMEVPSTLGAATISNTKSGLAMADHTTRNLALDEWQRGRREFLVAQNKDNSLLESGTLRIMGNEKIRAGNYIRIKRGSFSAIYYVVAVSHQILPYRAIYTTLTLERGLGFSNRVKSTGGVSSPYLNELVGVGSDTNG